MSWLPNKAKLTCAVFHWYFRAWCYIPMRSPPTAEEAAPEPEPAAEEAAPAPAEEEAPAPEEPAAEAPGVCGLNLVLEIPPIQNGLYQFHCGTIARIASICRL